VVVCPVDCIFVDPKHTETQEQLKDKYLSITSALPEDKA